MPATPVTVAPRTHSGAVARAGCSRAVLIASIGAAPIALAVAGLVPDLSAVVARVPFLCDFLRPSVITDALPYRELGQYLATNRLKVARVHIELAYFDGVNFAKRATAPVTMTAAPGRTAPSPCAPSASTWPKWGCVVAD